MAWSMSSTRKASCCRPGPERSRKRASVLCSVNGASSWSWAPATPALRCEHRLGHPLLRVLLPVQQHQAEHRGVERDGPVEIGHGDAHVVDGEQTRHLPDLGWLHAATLPRGPGARLSAAPERGEGVGRWWRDR